MVGLSGGVDSSVALWLLKKQGYQAIGLTLRLPVWAGTGENNICCTIAGIRWVKRLCLKLEVPHFLLDCRQEFQQTVVDYFVQEYRQGRTPNPCVICNQKFRFPKFFEFAGQYQAEFIATGHYVKNSKLKTQNSKVIYKLLRAKDKTKDQSYFLARLGQRELSRTLFPLGDYTKKEVYQMAKKQGFHSPVQRQESQDFCYVDQKHKNDFLKEALGDRSGPIVDFKGKILGRHQGLHFYTLGQRHGLGLNGLFYVQRLDAAQNTLVITRDRRDLYQKEVIMDNWNFISGPPHRRAGLPPKKAIKVQAKTRSAQLLQPATLYPPKGKKLRLVFTQPQFAITPGQFCVFYVPSEASAKLGEGETCLGSGAITS